MKRFTGLVLILGLLASAPVLADEQAEAAAARLLDAMNMEATLKGTVDAALEAQLAQKPEMAPYREVFRAFFEKHLRYEALKPRLAAIYAAEFSAAELDEATAFYATPTGRKFLEKTPTLFSKGAEIGQEAIASHLPELQEAIRVESERLQKLGKAAGHG